LSAGLATIGTGSVSKATSAVWKARAIGLAGQRGV
jgi:hypothetical protein